MLKSLSMYETFYDMVSKASDPVKPILPKSHSKFRDKMDDQFVEMCCDWKAYREDTGLGTDDFNKIDVETGHPVVKHNDVWFDELQATYFDLCGRTDDILDKLAGEKKAGNLLISQIEAEVESNEAAINKLRSNVFC